MTLEMMIELFVITHAPDVMHMLVGEEEVPLSLSSAITVPSEEEEVLVP
jgi:hypothetical protein